jgi:uncharacterized surface protein with fasciclin (FAS1) repeats
VPDFSTTISIVFPEAFFLLVTFIECFLHRIGRASRKLLRGGEVLPDIVDTAMALGTFNNLVKAVIAAGLVDTLKSPGPFTVFVPTDDAFAKILRTTLKYF